MSARTGRLKTELHVTHHFATTPADGHTVPALPIVRALIERGHSVRWYAGRKYADRIQAIGVEHSA